MTIAERNKILSESNQERDKKIVQEYSPGNGSLLAQKYHLTRQRIHQLVKKHGENKEVV